MPVLFALGDGVLIFVGAGITGCALRFLDRLDMTPIVGWRLFSAIAIVCEGEEEEIRAAVLGISAATALGDTDEAKRLSLADRWGYGCAVHAVLDEMINGDR